MSKINVTLAIRATDDPNRVKLMLDFLKAEGFTLTPSDGSPPNIITRPPIQATRLATYGPNETAWRADNPNSRAPVYSPLMQSKYPNKEDMFGAYLDGTISLTAPGKEEPNEPEGIAEGAVLTGPIVIAEPDVDDYA